MDGSNGKIVELLERIAAGQDGLREEMQGTRDEIQSLRTETRADSRSLRAEMRDGFNKVDSRLDHMLKFLGGHHADHEERIVALEDRVLGKRKNS
jgi:hypothetical protein